MSTLLLVRHAQASFLSDDYDRLSELGIEQARRLGRHLAALGSGLDAVFVGPRRRHAHTAEVLLSELDGAPAPAELAELDEYPAEEVLKARIAELCAARADLAELAGETSHADRRRRGRAFDLLLQAALRDWIERDLPDAGHETWQEFHARTTRALAALTRDEGRGRRVLVVSSAGTIGALAAQVLCAPPETALELGFMLNNAAVTEIAFSGQKSSLARFNVLGHLPDPSHWTRR